MNQAACDQYLGSIRRLNAFLTTSKGATTMNNCDIDQAATQAITRGPFTFYLVRHPKIHHNADAPLIAVQVGERGYFPIYASSRLGNTPQQMADSLNKTILSKEVSEAALCGSMFGWDTPAAKAALEYAEEHTDKG